MPILAFIFFAVFSQPLHASGLPDFVARYQINYGDIHLGEADYRFRHVEGNRYQFDFSSYLRFLIFWDERVVESKLTYAEPRLLPRYYSHDRKGTGRDYLEVVDFDEADGIIRSSYQDDRVEFPYEPDVIDGLTVQLQLMLDLQRGVNQPKYRILDENEIREREFRFVGEETITIQDADCQTVIYEIVRDNDRRRTQMWFSPERNFLPVQMVHYSKGKKKFNAQLLSYAAQQSDPASP